MKTIQSKVLTVLLTAFILIGANSLFAQHGQMNNSKQGAGLKCNIPDLTEEQQKKMDDLRLVHQKNMLQFKNQMDVKNAQLNLLTSADKADMNAINKSIDEIGALKIQMMKEKENHHQQVRSILTDKQRVTFDMQKGKEKHGGQGKCGMGMGNGNDGCRGKGKCPNTK